MKHASYRSLLSPRQQLWLLLSGALAVLWSVVAFDHRRDEFETLAQVQRQTDSLALAFAEHTKSTFQRVDHALLELRDAWRAGPESVAHVLVHQEDLLAGKTIEVAAIDAEGYLAYSSLAPVRDPIYLGDREHFNAHAESDGDRLLVSKPIIGRNSGRWSIQLTRAIFEQERFAGVMALSVDPSYFVRFYQQIDLGSRGVVALVHDNGEIMARSVGQDQYVGRKVTTAPFTDSGAPLRGHFRRISELDGIDRILSFHRLPEHQLTVIVSASIDESLAPVFGHRRTVLAMAGGVTLLLLVIAWHMYQGIVHREEAEARLHLAASVFTHAREGIMITNADGTIVDVNDIFTDITGYSREEAVGQNPRMLNSGHQAPEFYADMWGALEQLGHWYGELWNRHKDGTVYAAMIKIGAVHDPGGRTQNYVALMTDITANKVHQKELEHIAHFDALTGLPNRVLLADRLRQALVQTHRRGKQLAVAYLDLDGFKAVNDNHGHDVGDELLITIAQRMKMALRQGDTLGRLGGDEFVAVMADLEHPLDYEPVLARLLRAAAEPVTIGEAVLNVSASIGVTLYQRDGVDADQLLRYADQAMYVAKQAGRNRYHLFDVDQDSEVKSRHEALERIRRAFDHQEFVLHYQPKVNMRTGEVVGAEALVRWQHPARGLLPPSAFLSIIDNHALGVKLGEWVLDTALTDVAKWHAQGLDVPVSINIGARQLQQNEFAQRLRDLLAAHPDVRPHCLELEVLETSAMEDMALFASAMHACREVGVTFALDDFGTGYSSLTYLRRLPVDVLKIDQSFVHDMLDNPEDLAIVEGVLGLAAAFGRSVIAEGVETIAHGELLLPLGCDVAQGHAIARPMPGRELPDWVRTWRPHAAWTAWRDRPLSHDDRAVVFAMVEHRHWLHALKACLSGTRNAPPPPLHDDHFGRWLQNEGRVRYGEQSGFREVTAAHDRLHAMGADLVALHARGAQADTQALLEELHARYDTMVEMLRVVVQREPNDEVRHAGPELVGLERSSRAERKGAHRFDR